MNKFFLLKLKATRDPELFAQFYDEYVDKIYRFIYFKVSSVEDVHDLTSDVFLKVWQYLLEGKRVKNLNALAYAIARNLVVDYYRKKTRQDITGLEGFSDTIKFSENVLEDKIDINLELRELFQLLSGLKDDYREVLLLRYIEGYSIKEVALIMGKSVSSTKVLLHRAKKRLAKERENKRGLK